MHNNTRSIGFVSTRLVAALLVSVSLSACAIGSDYQKPETALPEQWPWVETTSASPYQAVAPNWWQQFDDPALTALIEEGIKANADLLVAAARVSQARGMLTGRQAELYPSIDAQAGAARIKNSKESAAGAMNSKPFNDLNLGVVLNYELDLWGRIRRSTESARAQLLASQFARDTIYLAVVGNIAQSYFNLRALDEQLDITEHTILSREDALEFQRKQYDVGGQNALTYHQAEAELAAAQAQKPLLEQARMEQESALAILLGRSPRDIVQGKIAVGQSIDNLTATPSMPADLPSDLLERRPDIAMAEQSLISANADIAVAKADYFPRISLSGLLGLASSDADDLLRGSAKKWQVGSGLSVPILNFGRTSSNVDVAEARKEESLINYEQSIRVAFKEVMDALSAERTSATREEAQARQMKSRTETLRLSDLRYKSGYSDYLEVLDAQRYLYQAQMDRVAARRDRLIAVVNLYRALGGGWNTDVPAKPQAIQAVSLPVMQENTIEQQIFIQEPPVQELSVQELSVQELSVQEPVVPEVTALQEKMIEADTVTVTEPAAQIAEESAFIPEVEVPTLPEIQTSPAQQPMQLPSEMM